MKKTRGKENARVKVQQVIWSVEINALSKHWNQKNNVHIQSSLRLPPLLNRKPSSWVMREIWIGKQIDQLGKRKHQWCQCANDILNELICIRFHIRRKKHTHIDTKISFDHVKEKNSSKSQSYQEDRVSVMYSQSVLFFSSSPQTSRDLATTPSCRFLCSLSLSLSLSRFPRLMTMMMVVLVVVVFPVTAILATFSFSLALFLARSLSLFFARAQEHAISLFQSTTHFCRRSTITTTTTRLA